MEDSAQNGRELAIEKSGLKRAVLMRDVKGMIKGAGVSHLRSAKKVKEGNVVAVFESRGMR